MPLPHVNVFNVNVNVSVLLCVIHTTAGSATVQSPPNPKLYLSYTTIIFMLNSFNSSFTILR
ncbi:hypothetical protein AAHE18_13G196200 [Arachis hypogaea]